MAYATRDEQILVELTLQQGATVADVLQACAGRKQFPDSVLASADVGVFGRRVALDHVLEAGDRVEIYRPLNVDPKEARRLRASNK
ncbi:MAG TPA: RnfH family protein [Gammaproteobacteria bacterium]